MKIVEKKGEILSERKKKTRKDRVKENYKAIHVCEEYMLAYAGEGKRGWGKKRFRNDK
jgi:hypothetical protein